MSQQKFYRPNVAAIIVSSAYPQVKEIFIAERNDLAGVWQFPQGGIDEGETSEEALFRELKEEIGTNKVEIVSEYPEWISYDFPTHVAAKMAPFAGQKQRYYLVRLKLIIGCQNMATSSLRCWAIACCACMSMHCISVHVCYFEHVYACI